jgi:hypothetical protein
MVRPRGSVAGLRPSGSEDFIVHQAIVSKPGLWAMGAVVACVAPILVGCGSSPAARYGAYEQAVNRGDIPAAMDIVADDFVFTGRGGEAVGGRADLQRDLERGAVFGRKLSSEDRRVRNGALHMIVTDRSAYYQLLGMEPRQYRLAVEVEGGKISAMTVGENLSEGPTEREALPAFLTWARGQRRAEISKIYPVDRSENGTESGRIWLELLQLWREQGSWNSINIPEPVDLRPSPSRFTRDPKGPNVPAPKPEQRPAPRRPQ